MKIQKSYETTDVHVAGEAFRIIKSFPIISYQNLVDLYEQFPQVFAEEINLLLNEPRGFCGLNGCLVVPPIHQDADAAVLFFNHKGTVPLHYGGIVAVITALLECGQLKAKSSHQYKLETLHGVISVQAVMEEDEVISVELESEPCQVIQMGLTLPHLNLGFLLVQADQIYAVFNKRDLSIEIQLENLAELRRWAQVVFQQLDPKLSVKRAILVDDSTIEEDRLKSITFRDDYLIVRSPGFGSTIASYACQATKRGMRVDFPYINESIFGSQLKVKILDQSEEGIRFTFMSRGFITGMQNFVLDPTDPLAAGFLLK
jgi:proline racemase